MHSTTHPWLYRPGADAPELERAEAVRRAGAWLRSLHRDSTDGERIAVEHADSTWIDAYGGRAAAPRVATYDLGHAWRIELHAPFANAKNTSVIWDDAAQVLAVAVWRGAPPRRRRSHFPPPEAVWVRRFQLPTADFSRAEARVHRGVITVQALQCAPRRASWEPASRASS